MKITGVRVRITKDQAQTPVTNALGTSEDHFARAHIMHIVEVFTDEDVSGVVVADGGNPTLRWMIEHHLQPLIVGEDPRNYERLWRKMFGEPRGWRHQTTKGEAIRAIGVVDTAIWDLIGKASNTPLYQLLGGFRDRVPCYASGGHYVSLDSQADELRFLETETPRFIELGYRAVKMRVGRHIGHDCQRAKLVRDIIGPDVHLMMDFNFSQTYHGGAGQAIRFMRALEPFDPYWFEDPLIMDDITGLKQVCDAIATPIATGEREQAVWGFRELVVNRAADILLPDAVNAAGGVTQWRAISALAEAYRIPMAGHAAERVHTHCVAATPNGLTVEMFRPLEERRHLFESNPIRPDKDGMVSVPQTPGLGVELDEHYIAGHLIENY